MTGAAELAPSPIPLRHRLLPFHLALADGFRKHAQQEPLWKVMTWALGECHAKVEVLRGAACPTGPQLIIANDPSPFVFSAMSVVPRDDVFFIGAPGWKRMGGCIAERCLPAFTIAPFRTSPKEFLRAQLVYRLRDKVTPEMAGRINIESLTRMAELISGGATGMLTPAGGTIARGDNWKHGVGLIARRITNSDTKVVMMCIRGTRPRDATRMLLNPLWFPSLRKPLNLRIECSPAFPLPEFRQTGLTNKEISLRIKQRYLELFGSL